MDAPVNTRGTTRPTSLIFTLYGDMVSRLAGDGSLWIGDLVRLMAPFGLSEPAVRQAVSRMSRQGWLTARREGNRAFYAVTERGRRRIEELSPRIYGPVIDWDGRWRMLTYSVNEAQREQRDRLRKELAVLGWAPLSASTWISPADGLEAARNAAAAVGALDCVDLFAATYEGPLSDRELLEKCWDVAAIARAYRDFIASYESRPARERREGHLSDEAAFVERLWLVHEFRKFAYVDPGLPSELLPPHWPGTTAAALFRDYYEALETKSMRYLSLAGAGAARVEPTAPCPNAS